MVLNKMKKATSINKQKVNSFIKIIAFIIVFVLLLEALSLSIFSKNNAINMTTKYARSYSYIQEPDNSIQIACLGNSDLYSGFVPTVLWEKYGYTSTILANPRQTPARSYELLKDLLKSQQPNLVILETDMLYAEEPKNNAVKKLSFSKNNFDNLFAYLNTDDFGEKVENHFSIFLFHDRWKKIGLKKKDKPIHVNSHGYKYNTDIRKIKKIKYMIKTDKSEDIEKESLIYFDKMIKLCKQNNIEIIFVEMPSVNSWNYERHNAAENLAKSYNINFIDLNLCLKKMKFDMDSDFRDKGNHLNYSGAAKATDYIGNAIKEDYDIEDRRNSKDYEFWNENLAEFKKINNIK